MNDVRLALMCGSDIPIPESQLAVHQPKIKEIALIGEADFFVAIQCLNVNKDLLRQDKTLLQNTSNFQIFMTIMSEKETKDKKFATQQLLQLLFPKCNVMFTPRSILLQGEGFSQIIDENNFEAFQNIIKQIFCVSNKNNQQAGFNPANEKAL